MVLVSILIFMGCFGAGTAAAARWLPDLDAGPVGGLAFFVVCGLLGAASSVAGLEVYSTARELNAQGNLGLGSSDILANGI